MLVDFCTYTCINWLRTLPWIRGWAAKYKSHGLIVIGAHTPEFAFEQNLANVRPAIGGMKIEHPIAIDNDYAIWRAFRNNYWPALYFMDAGGRVRESHFGEGEYERSERTIQRLLTDAGAADVPRDLLSADARGVEVQADWSNLRSPENYLGHQRTENFASRGGADQIAAAPMPRPQAWRSMNGPLLVNGRWGSRRRLEQPERPARVPIPCARSAPRHGTGAARRARALPIDDRWTAARRGSRTGCGRSGNGVVADQRMYQLIRQPMPIVDRLMQIEFLDAGAESFAFTFG